MCTLHRSIVDELMGSRGGKISLLVLFIANGHLVDCVHRLTTATSNALITTKSPRYIIYYTVEVLGLAEWTCHERKWLGHGFA